MSNRPAGGARSKRWARADYDWYREPEFPVRQLFEALQFGTGNALDLIYDPCCGGGNILDVAKRRGHLTFGSDVVDRKPLHRFVRGNFLNVTKCPTPPPGHSLSIVCNPPYSYEPDIAERIMRHALDMPVRMAAFLVPIAFLCGQERWRFFAQERNPSHVLYCSQRPTMPPGHLVDQMASPYEGGMADYVWVVFTGPRHRWRTQSIWLRPDSR
jgi:hypothetical protein